MTLFLEIEKNIEKSVKSLPQPLTRYVTLNYGSDFTFFVSL